jgi:DNA gyrase/topoisomerase IV subunit A
LRDLLRAWLDHRHEVLQRRSAHRLEAIAKRLEILNGYLAVYLNLDEVIRIIRNEDEPKPKLIKTFKSSTCGCAPCAGSKKPKSARSIKNSASNRRACRHF